MFVTFSSLSSLEGVDTSYFNIPYFDKIVHFGFYFVMVILGVFAMKEQYAFRFKFLRGLIFMLVFAVVYGIIIELSQALFTESRHGDVLDVVANVVGAFCGMLTAKLLFSNKWPLK